jgi:hypothetical protein
LNKYCHRKRVTTFAIYLFLQGDSASRHVEETKEANEARQKLKKDKEEPQPPQQPPPPSTLDKEPPSLLNFRREEERKKQNRM